MKPAFEALLPVPSDPLLCRSLPPAEVLNRILRHDPETNELHWKRRPRDLCMSSNAQASFNATRAGKRAGGANQKICIFGTVHRIEDVIHRMTSG